MQLIRKTHIKYNRKDTYTKKKLKIHEVAFHSKIPHKPAASRNWKTDDKGAEMPEKESRGLH